jgi:hypothetical protein
MEGMMMIRSAPCTPCLPSENGAYALDRTQFSQSDVILTE